jgi:hypothetical protein
MAHYILLRNNKEEGPFTLEQITTKGFKPYDLVWIEGKSAGWRYPSEIAELKTYAPVVEEQPYDRFYKKTSEQTQNILSETTNTEANKPTVVNQSSLTNTREAVNISPKMEQQTEKTIQQPAKRIYVTIPSNPSKPVVKKPVQKIIIEEEKNIIEEKPKPVINSEPQLKEKFSQPLDDIKKMYVDSLLKQNSNKHKKIVIPEKLKIAAAVLFLLLAGTAVGLLINKKSPAEKIIVANVPEQKVINTAPSIDNGEPSFAKATGDKWIEENKQPLTIPNEPVNKSDDNEPKEKVTTPLQEEPIISQSSSIKEKSSEENVVEDLKPAAGNRKAVKRESAATTNRQPTNANASMDKPETSNGQPITTNNKPNLSKEINITASNYKKATFGGISDLEFTVSNGTSYIIDMVIAEVDYYTANKKIYKTETVYFKNIAPKGIQVQQAPNSNRGYEVKYRISLISSKELGIYTAGM